MQHDHIQKTIVLTFDETVLLSIRNKCYNSWTRKYSKSYAKEIAYQDICLSADDK